MIQKLSISTLGNNGRFGNQLFQLAFGLGLAEKYNVPLQLPDDWVGFKIFDLRSDLIVPVHIFADITMRTTEIDHIPRRNAEIRSVDHIDLYGYWQFQDALDLYSRTQILKWFDWKPWVKDWFHLGEENHKYTVVVHKRRGDYVKQPRHYCSITDDSFRKTVLNHLSGAMCDDARDIEVQWLTEENPGVCAKCDDFGLSFLPDFMKMVKADCVIRSNSTFSWWGPVFGKNNVLSPVVTDLVGWNDVEFVPGNWPRMADSSRHPNSKLTNLVLAE